MTNTVNIPGVTLAQAAESTNAVNLRGDQDYLKPRVIRLTDHVNNDTTEVGDDTDKMALFYQKAYGHPWIQGLRDVDQVHLIHQGTTAIPTNVTVLYPNFDYSTFA